MQHGTRHLTSIITLINRNSFSFNDSLERAAYREGAYSDLVIYRIASIQTAPET